MKFKLILLFGILIVLNYACASSQKAIETDFGDKAVVEAAILWQHVGDIGIRPLIKASIGKIEGLWLLDTGSSHFIIIDTLAKSNKLKKTGSTRIATAAGLIQAARYLLPAMNMGELRLTNIPVLALNLSQKYPEFGHQIMGIIGAGLLSSTSVELDFPNNKLRFFHKELLFDQTQNSPIIWRRQIPMIEIAVANGKYSEVIFDTGNVGALVIFPGGDLYKELIAINRGKLPGLSLQGDELGQTLQVKLLEIKEVQFSGSRAYQVPTSSLQATDTGHPLANWNASLGILLIKQCRWRFSDGHAKSWCPQEFRLPGGFGLTLREKKGLITVNDVLVDSPAALAGIIKGDILQTKARNSQEFWNQNANRNELELRVRNPSTQRIRSIGLIRKHFLPVSNSTIN